MDFYKVSLICDGLLAASLHITIIYLFLMDLQVTSLLEFKQRTASTDVLAEYGMESVNKVTQGILLVEFISLCHYFKANYYS